MPKRLNMCVNKDCPQFEIETGFLGGCGECGTMLVPVPAPEPTNEQLESLMAVMGMPFIPGAADRNPAARQAMLNFHNIVQRTANGDLGAAQTLETLKNVFGR